MTKKEFNKEIIRRFIENVIKNMPNFDSVQTTEDPNVFIGEKNGELYFIHLRSSLEPVITFRKAQVNEIIKDNRQ